MTTRRDFLKTAVGGATAVALSPALPPLLASAAEAAAATADHRETVLVVVQLSGGNDGLNTVVPYADDHYARSRPTLALPTGKLHKIDSLLGFHPRMAGFAQLFHDGHLTVVQGVGYPNPSGDHQESMRIWQSARRPAAQTEPGWIGRATEQRATDTPQAAAALVTDITRPLALNSATAPAPRLTTVAAARIATGPGSAGKRQRETLDRLAKLSVADTDNSLLNAARQATIAACAGSRRVDAICRAAATSATGSYPDTSLARSLATVAQLIRAELGIRIFYTELGGDGFGGFDNHANQRGNHGALLHQLSAATAAFAADLCHDRLLDRVVLMTFSEFGRTVAENGRRGTGHGSAAPMFLVGGGLRSGLVGRHPNLTDLENGGTRHHTDFRSVYATLLDRWLGLDSQAVLGKAFPPIGLLTGRA